MPTRIYDIAQSQQPTTRVFSEEISVSPAPTGVTIRATSPEIHALVERVLAGHIPFTLEVSRHEGSPPLRATLVQAPANFVTDAARPRPAPPPRAELDERTKDLFRAAYYSARHVSKDDWVNFAEYGSALKRQDPTFQPQDFGERNLGGLVRRMLEDFEVKADENTPPVYHIRIRGQRPAEPANRELTTEPARPAGPRRLAKGRVHNLKLGFGFIAPDDGGQNAFFHATEVVGCTIFDLRPGDAVEYEAGTNERGPCAWKVRRVSSGNTALENDLDSDGAADESENFSGFLFRGQQYRERNAIDVLFRVFEVFSQLNPRFLETYAALPKHGRVRRYLARSKWDLYPGRTDLAEAYSQEKFGGWWIGTNYSRSTIRHAVELACEVAGVRFGEELKLV
jgi:cold shock CspA family protein